jgi:biotin carboxyl carrier protein
VAGKLRITDGRREWTATVDGSVVTVEGIEGEFTLTPRADGRWAVEHQGRTAIAVVARSSEGLWIGVDGSVGQWQARPASSRSRQGAIDDEVRAPMSATVIRVLASEGTQVSEGDTLVVVEAMKMEMPLRAPRSAVVKAIRCREGELVQAAAILVELE